MKNAMYYFKDIFYPGGAEGARLRDGQGHQLRGQDADCGRGESQVAGVSPNNTVYAVDDDTNITAGSGRIYITPEGDLRIYGNTNSYPILAGEIIVDVLW